MGLISFKLQIPNPKQISHGQLATPAYRQAGEIICNLALEIWSL